LEAFLRGVLRDLDRRSTMLRTRLAAVTGEPDIQAHRLAGYQRAESLRREVLTLLADPSLGTPALLANHLRAVQALERSAILVECYFLPFVERYGELDRQLTRLCRRLITQVRWPLPPPLILAFSNQYYWTLAPFNLISAPATAGASLLRLPDLCHELGHLLQEHHQAVLIGDFVAELAGYIDQERRRAAEEPQGPRPPYLYDELFAQWRDAWLVEFVADLVATYLTGPAFGWQHSRLCFGEGQTLHEPALGQVATHPAEEARLRGVLAMLRLMDSAEGPAIQALWAGYLKLRGEAQPADYDVCYPRPLLNSLARQVIEGCQALGLRSFREPPDPHASGPDIPRLLGNAWRQFIQDADNYPAWERARLAELWSTLGLPSPTMARSAT
jgi:hypothetical protein